MNIRGFGYNGMLKDNHIAGEGNAYYTLFREYDPILGRWWSADPLRAKYPDMSPYIAFGANPVMFTDPMGDENIAVAGYQYDTKEGNKWMFVNQSLREVSEWNKNEPNESRTLLLFKGDYSEQEITQIEKSLTDLGGKLVTVNSSKELINYLNSMDIKNNNLTDQRKNDLISNLSIFAHGHPDDISFGYKSEFESSYMFYPSNIYSIKADAFVQYKDYNSISNIKLYTCRSAEAMGNNWFEKQWNQTFGKYIMTKMFATHLNIVTYGFTRRCYYGGDIWDKLKDEKKESFILNGGLFYPKGPSHTVKAGDTPWGASTEFQGFKP